MGFPSKFFGYCILSLASFTLIAAPNDRPRLDTDGDGLISFDEFQANERGLVQRMDNNDDGVVTLEEIHAAAESRQQEMIDRQASHQARLEAHFTQADVNQDGMVTDAEAKTAAFQKLDQDADGYLSREEMRAARKHHGGGPHGRQGKRAQDTI